MTSETIATYKEKRLAGKRREIEEEVREALSRGEKLTERQKKRYLLYKSFREMLDKREFEVNSETDAVVVLSEASNGEVNREDQARIKLGIRMVKEIAAKKVGKDVSELTNEDIESHGPLLVLNAKGSTQLHYFLEFINSLNESEIQVMDLDCDDENKRANTKTQMEAMKENDRLIDMDRFLFISSYYHGPRVVGTADASLPKNVVFDAVFVGPKELSGRNGVNDIRGEMRRIIAYSRDVAFFPERGMDTSAIKSSE